LVLSLLVPVSIPYAAAALLAYLVWRLTHRPRPVEAAAQVDDSIRAMAARGRCDDAASLLAENIGWLLSAFTNETQLLWNRFNFCLAAEALLVVAASQTSSWVTKIATAVIGLLLFECIGRLVESAGDPPGHRVSEGG
jgi:nicotinamide riboside transporter PnuC